MNDSRRPVALITGGSAGLGLAMAERFRAGGFAVVILARHCPDSFTPDEFVGVDLSCRSEREKAAEHVKTTYPVIDVLVNNAGIGVYATHDELPENELRRVFELDYFTVVGMTKELLGCVEAAHGTIVNVSSVAGLMPVACMGPYSSVKAAVWMFSESLRMELCGRVNVMTVAPGRISTGFSDRAVRIRQVPRTPGQQASSAGKLADLVFKGVKSGRQRLIYPWFYRFAIWFSRWFPGMYSCGNRRVWKLD